MNTAQTPALPADLQSLLDQIDDADRAVEPLIAGLSDQQFHWQPDGGRAWSIAQCLEHLATMNAVYSKPIREAVAVAHRNGWTRTGTLAPGALARWFIRSQEPPVKRRLKSPGPARPGSQLSRTEIVKRYHDAHEQVRALIRDAATIDANRATYPNPFLKMLRFKVATGLMILPAHDRRHLWQAEQVKKRPEFPKA
jgi:hypothetical protein